MAGKQTQLQTKLLSTTTCCRPAASTVHDTAAVNMQLGAACSGDMGLPTTYRPSRPGSELVSPAAEERIEAGHLTLRGTANHPVCCVGSFVRPQGSTAGPSDLAAGGVCPLHAACCPSSWHDCQQCSCPNPLQPIRGKATLMVPACRADVVTAGIARRMLLTCAGNHLGPHLSSLLCALKPMGHANM